MTTAAPSGSRTEIERNRTGMGSRRRKRSRVSAIADTLLRQPFQPLSASVDLSSTPEPPHALPEGRVVHVPGRRVLRPGQRRRRRPVLLLHGWTVTADLNWSSVYEPLVDAGYRVLAMDHRGHGRGLRSPRPFRLSDCADDAAALLETLDVGPVLAVGYSMGGPIAQLLARDHRSRSPASSCAPPPRTGAVRGCRCCGAA